MHHQIPRSGESTLIYSSIVRPLTWPKEVNGRPDITIDLTHPGSLDTLSKHPFTIKEGTTYQMKVVFTVNHEVLSGLKYIQSIKRKGIRVSKDQEMIGSFAPNTTDNPEYIKRFTEEEAPSGMLARGHYEASVRFTDDDDRTHLEFNWSFDIAKDWK
jgi:Rho GDP-dissociation inhibitor